MGVLEFLGVFKLVEWLAPPVSPPPPKVAWDHDLNVAPLASFTCGQCSAVAPAKDDRCAAVAGAGIQPFDHSKTTGAVVGAVVGSFCFF